MTQPSLLDAAVAPALPEGDDFTARVARLLLARVGEWVDSNELMRVGGRCAWRTRVSEARHVYGLTIENRVRTVHDDAGRRWRVSEYRVVEG